MSDSYIAVNDKLLGHIEAIRELGAFAYSQGGNQEMGLGERRRLDRIGTRATDLIEAITEYVSRSV